MMVKELWLELLKRNRLLAWSGLLNLVLLLVLAMVATFDSTQILGINRWIKPMKFAVSIAIYQWTLAWLTGYLKGKESAIRIISRVIVIVMICEMVPIVGQAARGTLSHYNRASVIGGMIYAFMGVMIVINTMMAGWLLKLFLTEPTDLPVAYLWGIRLGLILFLLGSVEGGLMASLPGHTVGAPDGGPGLPLTNWSTIAGDLRVAHALGLHALQVMPLLGFWFARAKSNALWLTLSTGGIYFIVMLWLFIQAMNGQPLIGMK